MKELILQFNLVYLNSTQSIKEKILNICNDGDLQAF